MACADYIEALLLGEPLDTAPIIHRVRDSYVARTLFNSTMPGFPVSDIEYCVDVDRFDFAMRIRRENGLLVMKPAQ
jgi:2-phosphosulfolactate phosphatase